MSEHLDLEQAKRLLRGELEARESSDVERHLEDCAECRRMVAEERALRDALELDETPQGDGAALKRLLHRVDAAPIAGTPPRRRRRVAPIAIGSAAVLTLALGAASLWTGDDPNRRLADEAGISVRRQAAIVAHLDELQTLAEEPWLARRYHTVAAIDRLIEETP